MQPTYFKLHNFNVEGRPFQFSGFHNFTTSWRAVGEQLASDCRQVPLPCKLLSTMATKAITRSFSIQHLVFITNEKNSFITISQIVLSCVSVWVDFQDLLLVLHILRLRQVISLGWFRFGLRLSLSQ